MNSLRAIQFLRLLVAIAAGCDSSCPSKADMCADALCRDCIGCITCDADCYTRYKNPCEESLCKETCPFCTTRCPDWCLKELDDPCSAPASCGSCGNCEAPWEKNEYYQHILCVDEVMSQPDAEAWCANYDQGAKLVSIRHSYDNAWLLRHACFGLIEYWDWRCIWTGYNDKHEEGVWKWPEWGDFRPSIQNSNASEAKYENWGPPEEPNNRGMGGVPEHCMEMCTNFDFGRWNDGDCNLKRKFCCELTRKVTDEEKKSVMCVPDGSSTLEPFAAYCLLWLYLMSLF